MGYRLSNDVGHAEGHSVSSSKFQRNFTPTDWPKRALDLLIAIVALIFLSPLILLMAVLIRLQDGGPAFFTQRRVGKHGEVFHVFKLRSMIIDAEDRLDDLLARDPEARREWDETQKLENDPRVTPLGNFIRKSSIDELPQLLNIIKGEMSLVGPRPITEVEVPRYTDNFKYYCSVCPGITGLWQVGGRSDVTYKERVLIDVKYVETQSFWGDLKILILTIPAVLASRGAR